MAKMIWTPASRKEPSVTVTVSSQGALEVYPHVGFLFIGTSLDFIAGTQVRAPRFAWALAAEWVWRLIRNPCHLAARYGAFIVILPCLLIRAVQACRLAGQSAIGRSCVS